jgi:hypothetical protein
MRAVLAVEGVVRLLLPACAAACLIAAPARAADQWSAWEPADDGHEKRIYLRSNTPTDCLGPETWRLKNGYPVPVQVEVHIVDHQGDAAARSDAFTQVVRRRLRPGQVWNLRTIPTVSVNIRRLELLTATPAPQVSTRR